jgi:hypothetical protein
MPTAQALNYIQDTEEDETFKRRLKHAADAASTFQSGISLSEILRLAFEHLKAEHGDAKTADSRHV